MIHELCLRMPYMHPGLNNEYGNQVERHFANLKYFWPGHATLDSSSPWWQADNLPLSSVEAASILASLQGQDLQDLERIRLLMQQRAHEEDRRFRSEMATLEQFLAAPENPAEIKRSDPPLKEAQINLLWLWHQEEEYLEIDSLARLCNNAESELLSQALDLDEAALSPGISGLETARELLPHWRKIFLNASYFIDAELPILLEGPMRDDLVAEFTFTNIIAENSENDFILKKALLPLWQILDFAHKNHASPFLDRIWNRPRILYVLARQ